MGKPLKRVAVTGAGGQIAYSILFRIATGEMLGQDQPIALHLLEVPEAQGALKGVVMELEDCAFPLLKEVKMGSDPHKVFEGVDYAILIGSKPRGPGMERKDLLGENGKIFIEQGKALNSSAASDVLVFVVGNPCNTNCLIAMHHAPQHPQRAFFCHDAARSEPGAGDAGKESGGRYHRCEPCRYLGQPLGDPGARLCQCPNSGASLL